MFKRLGISSVVILGSAAFAFAQGGPAGKATGGIGIQEANGHAWVEFDAHEAKGDRPAKGSFTWSLNDGERYIELDVQYVNVEGDTAWFAGKAVVDTAGDLEDDWLFVMAYDGGTPARNGDVIFWQWLGEDESAAAAAVDAMNEPANMKTITDGNLVVHTK